MAFEKYIVEQADGKKMACHTFRAIWQEYIEEKKSAGDVFVFINDCIGENMAQGSINDMIAFIAAIDAASTKPDKMAVVDAFYRVMIIAECQNDMYNTQAKVKTRLGLS